MHIIELICHLLILIQNAGKKFQIAIAFAVFELFSNLVQRLVHGVVSERCCS